jgi:hypothetical protein
MGIVVVIMTATATEAMGVTNRRILRYIHDSYSTARLAVAPAGLGLVTSHARQ